MITLIGNAHIDPVWLWQWREGYHEVKATFRSALDRMNENSDFLFTCSCACYYAWVEENDPEMFEEIRARVKEGRWNIVGGMWIQPDMNTPSGESLVRQTLLSQRYFKEKFGVTATVGYNVDSFGHNAMTPQILKKAGMDAYVFMRPGMHENAEIPEGTFLWVAPDGTEIPAHRIIGEYTRPKDVPAKIDFLLSESDRLHQNLMCFYGVGNHGGGPTIKNLYEIGEYQKNAPRGGEAVYGTPSDFFANVNPDALPKWNGELQHHASGCYSTHSRSKKLHREAENALLRMEKLGALSQALTGHALNGTFVRQAWEDLLFNEFHDLMGGCALPEALEDACRQLCEALTIAEREENAAIQRISWQVDTSKGLPAITRSKEDDWKLWGVRGLGTPVVVFNPHTFDAEDTVLIRRPLRTVTDDNGSPIPVQNIRATRTNGKDDRWDSVFRARVPALGYRLFWVYLEEKEAPVKTDVNAEAFALENRHLRMELDPETGLPCHLIQKSNNRDALNGAASIRLMDISACDTWAHNVFKFNIEAGAFRCEEVAIEETGPVRCALRAKLHSGESYIRIWYILNVNADCLEMKVETNLREKHKMVKICIPTGCDRAVSEIPYGVIERRQNGDEEHCQRFVAMAGENGGLALLNDGKYSYSAQQGELRMTIANTSAFADHYGQPYRDCACQYMDQDRQTFRLLLVPFEGAWQNARLNQRAETLNQPFVTVEETYHRGSLPAEKSGVWVENPAVAVTALKRSEDGNGYVVRAVETVGQPAKTGIDLPILNRRLTASFQPFEIRTFVLPDDKNVPIRETKTTEWA